MSHDQQGDFNLGLAIRKQIELPTKPTPLNRWRVTRKNAIEYFVYDSEGVFVTMLSSKRIADLIVAMGNRIEEQREAQARLEQQATQIAAMADKMLLVLREAVMEAEQRGYYKILRLAPGWQDRAKEIVDQFKTVEI